MKKQELEKLEIKEPKPGTTCQAWSIANGDNSQEYNLHKEGVLDFFYSLWLDGDFYTVMSFNQEYLIKDVFSLQNMSVNFDYIFTKIPEKKDTFKSSHRQGVEL